MKLINLLKELVTDTEIIFNNYVWEGKIKNQTKKYTLKTGEIITLKVDPLMLSYDSLNITAYDKDNNKIGAAYFNSDETNNPKILSSTDSLVKSQWRRKGVATAIYDFAKTFSYEIIKSKNQTSDGKEFTDSLNEAIVGDKIECDNCGWRWKIKDGGSDLYICHNILPSGRMCNHDNNPEKLQEEKKKRDRCLRIADRKFDKPSAYKSGAVVRCRKGDIWKGIKETDDPQSGKAAPYGSGFVKVTEEQLIEKVKETLRTWFSRKGEPGKKGGWVDCNTCREVDGKTKCKACGREKGETRSKYPSCRPTAAQCKTPGKGKKWGKTK
jgi:hypothetical protein